MTVTNVNLIKKGSAEREGTERTYTWMYQIISDSATETEVAVLNSLSITVVGQGVNPSVHPNDSYALAKRISVDRSDESRLIWMAEVVYSTTASDPSQLGDSGTQPYDPDDPLSKPVDVTVSTRVRRVPSHNDANGKQLVSSAWEPYNPLVTVDVHNPVVKFTRNELTFFTHTLSTFVNKTNSNYFLGEEAGLVLCTGISAKNAFGKNLAYWTITYEFEIQQVESPILLSDNRGTLFVGERSWNIKVLNSGYEEVDSSTYEAKKILDKEGRAVTVPQLLDKLGAALPRPINVDNATYKEYTMYKTVDFNILGLPV